MESNLGTSKIACIISRIIMHLPLFNTVVLVVRGICIGKRNGEWYGH